MILSVFRAVYPEFASAPDALVSAMLARAAREVDATIWGDHAEDGIGSLAAHYLASAPHGQMSRLQARTDSTTYLARYLDLRNEVTIALRVF